VGTPVRDRVELAVDVEDGDLDAVDVDADPLPAGDLLDLGDPGVCLGVEVGIRLGTGVCRCLLVDVGGCVGCHG
jgi:hypothetical protein